MLVLVLVMVLMVMVVVVDLVATIMYLNSMEFWDGFQ